MKAPRTDNWYVGVAGLWEPDGVEEFTLCDLLGLGYSRTRNIDGIALCVRGRNFGRYNVINLDALLAALGRYVAEGKGEHGTTGWSVNYRRVCRAHRDLPLVAAVMRALPLRGDGWRRATLARFLAHHTRRRKLAAVVALGNDAAIKAWVRAHI